jgi:hypothetical protein
MSHKKQIKLFVVVIILVLSFVFSISLFAQQRTDITHIHNQNATTMASPSFVANQIIRIDTNPVNIQGLKDLDALSDGIYHQDAVVHQIDMNTGIIIEFDAPTSLSGFVASVGGAYDNPAGYVWTIAKADTWDDMRLGTGSFELIIPATLMTDSGVVNLPLGDVHTAKVFQASAGRTVESGFVSFREIIPTLDTQLPVIYRDIQTGPSGLSVDDPPLLFNGRTDAFALINPEPETPVEIILDYGQCQATWTELQAYAGGQSDPEEYLWTLEMADTMADLTSQTDSYQLLIDNDASAGDVWWTGDLGGEYTGHIFRVTILRREKSGGGWEHIAEVEPKVKQLICSNQLMLPYIARGS